ncbi:hypothetical protein D3C72_2578890 [compost metagenome]
MGGGAVLPQGAVDSGSDEGAGAGAATGTEGWRDASRWRETWPGVTPPARVRFSI